MGKGWIRMLSLKEMARDKGASEDQFHHGPEDIE